MAAADPMTGLPPGFELDDAPSMLDDSPGAVAAAAENQPPQLRATPAMDVRPLPAAEPAATTAAALPEGFELDPVQSAPAPVGTVPPGFELDAPPADDKPKVIYDEATGKARFVLPPAKQTPATPLGGSIGLTGQKDIDNALNNYLAGVGDVVVAQPMHAAEAIKHAVTGEAIPPTGSAGNLTGDAMQQASAVDAELAATKGPDLGGVKGVLEQKIPGIAGNLVGLAPAGALGGVAPVAAQLGLGAAADKYVAAKQAGATDAQADEAAGVSGAINAGAGLVMGPMASVARGIAGPTAEAIAAGARPTLAQAAKFVGLDAAGNSAIMAGSQLATNAADQTIYDPTRPLSQGVGEAALTGLGFGAMHAPELVSAARDRGTTVPENSTTLQTQQQELVAGKRDAMIFPTGTKELPVPDGFARLKTADGVFHFNPDVIEPEEIKAAVQDGTTGTILDYGIASKPDLTQPHTAVVRRDAQGNEIEAVATDQAHLAQVLAKQGERAEPGQSISTENPADVIAQRQATNGLTPEEFTAQQEQVARQKRLEYYRTLRTLMAPEREQQISQEAADAQQKAKLANAQAALERAAQLKAEQARQAQAKQEVLQNAPMDTVADLAHGGDVDAHNELLARLDGNDLDYNIALKDAANRADERAQAAHAREQYEKESREIVDDPSQGLDLLDAVKQAGGLPHMDAGGLGLTGELETLKEGAPKGLFSRQQKRDLDRIRESVNEKGGFDFETPDELLNAVGKRLQTGKPMHGVVKLATEAEMHGNMPRVAMPPGKEYSASHEPRQVSESEERSTGNPVDHSGGVESARLPGEPYEPVVRAADTGSKQADVSRARREPRVYVADAESHPSAIFHGRVIKAARDAGFHGEIVYKNEAGMGAWADPRAHNRIYLNPKVMERQSHPEKQLLSWFERATQEEIIHDAQHQAEVKYFHNNIYDPKKSAEENRAEYWLWRGAYYREIYNQMTPEEIEQTHEIYGEKLDPGLTVQEFTRQLIQRKLSGETTEDVWRKANRPALIRNLQGLWEQLKARLVGMGNQHAYFVQDYLKGIEGVLADAKKASETPKPPDADLTQAEHDELDSIRDDIDAMAHVSEERHARFEELSQKLGNDTSPRAAMPPPREEPEVSDVDTHRSKREVEYLGHIEDRISQIDESLTKKNAEYQRLKERGAAKAELATVRRYIDQLKFEKADLIAERDDLDPAAKADDFAGSEPPRRPGGFHGQPVPHEPGVPEDVGRHSSVAADEGVPGHEGHFQADKGARVFGQGDRAARGPRADVPGRTDAAFPRVVERIQPGGEENRLQGIR